MNKIPHGLFVSALLLSAPVASKADTFFTDDFSNGSTTNGVSIPGGSPTASYTSYDFASTKDSTTSTIGPGLLRCKLAANTTSGWWETQALFTNNPVALVSAGDYVNLEIVFTNTTGTVIAGGSTSGLWTGLFNSGGTGGNNPPVPGGALANGGLTTAASPYATSNCASWAGYVGQIISNSASRIINRPAQVGATSSAAQDLLGNGIGSGAFNSPLGTNMVTLATNLGLTSGATYTVVLSVTLDPAGSGNTILSNALFTGAGTGGTMIYSLITNIATPLTVAYDGFAFGAFNKSASLNPQMDVSLISITGHSTVITNPPSIDVQPVSASAPTNTAVPFTVVASGVSLSYQWHRHSTNLVDGGNISGAKSPTLVINPVTSADYSSDYYVTVTGASSLSTNSVNVSLSSRTPASLVWSGNGNVWDLAATADWLPGTSVFNYGDNVTFDDTGAAGFLTVTLGNNYLSAGTVTVNNSTGNDYKFQGSGSISGPANLVYTGTGYLTVNNANSFSGGTLVSNASAHLVLGNWGGLGTGPVTFAKAGAVLEATVAGATGGPSLGTVIVADDFTFQPDTDSQFSGVFANLGGTAGKTLTINPLYQTNSVRIRVTGTNTTMDASIALGGLNTSPLPATFGGTQLAMYHSSGTQIYNGLISGVGGLIQRDSGTTVLTYQNTYSGGTTLSTGTIAVGADSTPTTGTVTSGPLGIGPIVVSPELTSGNSTGALQAYGGAHTIANPILYPTNNNQTLRINGTNALTLTGNIPLTGADGTVTNRTFDITNTALTTFTGVMSGNGCSVTKTGAGVLALTAAETYTGSTTNSAGKLYVNGSLSSSSVTVLSNAVLGGIGTIPNTTTINQGGTLAPGDVSSIGTLNLANLANNGNLFFRVNRSGSASDQANVSGTLTSSGSGTVTVTNLGATLQANDSFHVFNKAVTGANTLTVTGGNVVWNNNLATDGTISVLTPISSSPTNITAKLSNGSLTLSWPIDHLTWILQSNSVALGATNWFTVPNSSSTTNMTIPVVTGKTNVFYRLVAP